MYSVYFTRENRKKFAIFPLILKYIYSVYSYGTLDCRIDVNGLFSSLNESSASLIATKVQTLNVMSIESMTVLIHLMDVYICSYIFVIKCHLCISEKLCFYTAYIAVILLLNWFMHAWRLLSACRKKDSAGMTCMCIAHWAFALSPEAEGFLHSPENFCILYYL